MILGDNLTWKIVIAADKCNTILAGVIYLSNLVKTYNHSNYSLYETVCLWFPFTVQ